MFGIVIWYDNDTKSGIVWCEDQLDLAIVEESSLRATGTDVLNAGDQFMFRDTRKSGVRYVAEIDQFVRSGAEPKMFDPADVLKSSARNNRSAPMLRLVQ